MPARIGSKKNQRFHRTYIKEWRQSRGLSQDQVVERVRERIEKFSKASLSRLENGKQPYSQPILEALAWALSCEPQDLLMRRPDSELWSIIDTLEALPPDQRAQLAAIAKTFRRAS